MSGLAWRDGLQWLLAQPLAYPPEIQGIGHASIPGVPDMLNTALDFSARGQQRAFLIVLSARRLSHQGDCTAVISQQVSEEEVLTRE